MDSRLIPALNDNGAFVLDQYRNLCARLLLSCQASDQRCILITSSVPAEGKSLTAVNLAITIAQVKKVDVILIDGDLRHPTLHATLGITPTCSLIDYFNDQSELFDEHGITLENLVHPSEVNNLSLISIGEAIENPTEILTSSKMNKLIADLKQRYKNSYIIIDSPPAVPFSDPILLSQYVDWIIFVIKSGGPPLEAVRKAVSLLDRKKILGVVLNNADLIPCEYPYNYGHYSYKHYKTKPKN